MRAREYCGIPYFVDNGPPRRVWAIDEVQPMEETLEVRIEVSWHQEARCYLVTAYRGGTRETDTVRVRSLDAALAEARSLLGEPK